MEASTLQSKQLLARIAEVQSALAGTASAAPAKRYAASVLREVALPLEAINNLVYIVRQLPEGSEQLRIYLDMIEGELHRLNTIIQQTMDFCVR